MIDFTVVFIIFCIMLGLVLLLSVKLASFHQRYCREYRKRQVRDALLESTYHLLSNVDCVNGTCHCGSEIKGHAVWDNHSPVDIGQTMANNLMKDIEAILDKNTLENGDNFP